MLFLKGDNMNDILYKLYKIMLRIRLVESAIIKEYPLNEIRTPVHLCVGQEAIAAGISVNLGKDDYIISNHRCHGHCIAKGMNLENFFKELYGKEGGVTGGRGGSMHLCDDAIGILGTSSIVAGGIPIGAGVALKQKIKNEKNITVIYFGDGAVDEGVFWETINFSVLRKLPVLFVMEDNKYASQTSTEERHSYKDITEIIKNFGSPVYKVDGNDVVEVYKISNEIIDSIRNGEGPYFMYCPTYRWMGHVGCIDDTYTGYRSADELEKWKRKCPLNSLENNILKEDSLNGKELLKIKEDTEKEINVALTCAKEAAYAVD
jgi:pyruvate dehydrogenase E1 component alpha subunit